VKFLFKASYNTEGLQGVKSQGANSRIAAVEAMCDSLGGSLEAFYFAFGDTDAYVLVDLPDREAAAALATAVATSGRLSKTETVVLLTADEFDQALKRQVTYRAPGQ
jgi:uncharacterized protein with GYD domain